MTYSSLDPFELFFACAERDELVRTIDLNRCRMRRRAILHPLKKQRDNNLVLVLVYILIRASPLWSRGAACNKQH